MTREEAIEILENTTFIAPSMVDVDTALDMAISALSTEGDLISRQAVEEIIKAEMPERGMWEIEGDKEKETVCEVCVDLMQKLSDLSSAENKGEWIYKDPFDTVPYCSKCDKELNVEFLSVVPKICPNCGAKMKGE